MEYDPSKKKDGKLKPVVSGAKLSDKKVQKSFFEEDIKNVATDVVRNTLIPSAKTLLYNLITNAVGMSLWGTNGNPQERRSSNIPRVSYNNPNVYYQSERTNYSDRSRSGSGFNYEDITFGSIGDAELVLDSMTEAIEVYERVTVNDLYDLAGITPPANGQLSRYGWTSLRNAKVIKLLGGGFALTLPNPRPLD